jgi:Transposase DDE domain group 1
MRVGRSTDVPDWCRRRFGLAPNSTLRRHVTGLEESTAARFAAAPSGGKVRRFKEFFDAAKTWSRVRRIDARVEAGDDGTDTRFIVTNLGHHLLQGAGLAAQIFHLVRSGGPRRVARETSLAGLQELL